MPEKRGEWTVLDCAVLYRNPWITVREDRVIQPDGEVVVSPDRLFLARGLSFRQGERIHDR